MHAPLRKVTPWILAGILTFSIGLHFRLFPLTHNVSSDAYEKGTMLVIAKVRASIALQIQKQFPEMPSDQRNKIIQERFDQVVKEHSTDMRKAFDQAGQEILQHSKDEKHYLLASDAYYFLDLTQDLIEKGTFATQTKGGKFFHDKMLAPLGYWQPQTWHPYVGVMVNKIVKIFQPDADLMYSVGFTSILLTPFVIAAFLFACRTLGCTAFPAFIASIFFILAPIYLKRSTFAWYDDDAYNVFFPQLTLGLLFLVLNNIRNVRKTFIPTLLTTLVLALYAPFWAGWGFLWVIGIIGLTAIGFLALLKDKTILPSLGILITIFIFMPFLAIGLLFGPGEVLTGLLFSAKELLKFTTPSFKDWPDLFLVVGELKKSSVPEVISLTGGPILFTGGILAILRASLLGFGQFSTNTAKAILLTVAFVITFILSLSAQRFTILCLSPLSLLFAWGLNDLWVSRENLLIFVKKNTPAARITITTALSVILLLSLSFPIHTGRKDIRSLLSPIFNSAWERALVKLRQESPTNSVINTWWAPGHFVKAIARRSVTFDGASIKGEQAYWLTRVYLSQTEEEALGILRMLNASSNKAAEFLQEQGLPLSVAVPLIIKGTQLSPNKARNMYAQAIPLSMAETLTGFTHGTPPPSYFMIYNEVVDGNILLGYLGKWNFKKIEELNKHPEQLKKIPARGSKAYIDFIWSLVGGPFRQSGTLNPKAKNGTTILFDQGVTVNTANMSVSINSAQFGKGIPQSIFYLNNGTVQEKVLPGASLSYSALFFNDTNGEPRCVLMEHMLAKSLIMRLYFFDGAGLQYFKPFAKEQDLTGRTKIFIYEIDWSGLPAD